MDSQVEFYESMFVCGLSMHQKCSNYTLTNLLFSFYKFVRIIDLLVILPNPHLGALARPSTPKILRAKERAPTPYPLVVFTFGLVIESIKKFKGASPSIAPIFTYTKFLQNGNLVSIFNKHTL